jgi:hypothetical protein
MEQGGQEKNSQKKTLFYKPSQKNEKKPANKKILQ